MKKWQAWVHVKWKAGTPESAWTSWKKNKLIQGVWSTTGDWDCVIWLDVQTPDALEKFVWKEVRPNKWVDSTETTWAKNWSWQGHARDKAA